jgi:hypothetical protein
MKWLKAFFTKQSTPSRQDLIPQHQQLLTSWRNILRICLELQLLLGEKIASPDIAVGIVQARSEIERIKILLRAWGQDIIDQPEELSIVDADTVTHHLKLLSIHRGNLAILLKQQQLYGERDAPPMIHNSIADSRHEIQRIKSMLRTWSAPVTDQKDDVA